MGAKKKTVSFKRNLNIANFSKNVIEILERLKSNTYPTDMDIEIALKGIELENKKLAHTVLQGD